jgi:aspartokinase-like uncharacterized kinase
MKVGGALSHDPALLRRIGAAIGRAAGTHPLVVVPGGGPFADVVRRLDRDHGLSPTAAHWMAILGMDQYAWVLAETIPGAKLVDDAAGVRQAHAEGLVPVLAPARWLRAADELPHSWEVTSDALAAYLATLLGAERIVLLKPVAGGAELTDPWFLRTLPAGVPWSILGPEAVDRLADHLAG